jgi:DNA-binding NtrC family response regulator
MTRAAMSLLHAYAWPGNVRELKNVVELVCLMRPGKAVTVSDLPRALRRESIEQKDATLATDCSSGTLQLSLNQSLSDCLRQILFAAVALEGGNRSRAARRLGVSLRTVQRHLGPERNKTS